MQKFNTSAIERRLSHLAGHRRRFHPTAARRSSAIESFTEAGGERNSFPDPATKPAMLRVRDVMSDDVISVSPNTSVREIAEILSRNRISSVPVVDGAGLLLGLVEASDLIRRVEIGTESRSWWQVVFNDAIADSHDYVRSHGKKARDVMAHHPHTARMDEPLHKVANRMQRKRLRAMPIVRDERVVGMLSPSDFARFLARSTENVVSPNSNDGAIREELMARIRSMPWSMRVRAINATVESGTVHLFGWVATEVERRALHVVAENTPGVLEVHDNLHRARLHM